MESREPRNERFLPFLAAGTILVMLCIVMVRLPDSYASQLERNRFLDTSQAGWAYRLLAFAAIAQAVYGGFVILTIDKVKKARAKDEKTAALPTEDLIRSLARTAAGMVVLTLVYGVASFYVTGQRGGFWLFAVLAVFQAAWYYRQVGQVAKWLRLQPEPSTPEHPRAPAWEREPSDYSPPLGR